jgi:dTDP-4-dehydrorhamnose reductase
VLKTAVIGASGFVGRHLWLAYRRSHPDCIGTSFSAANPDLVHFDIRQPNVHSLQLEEQGYRAVVIAAAKPNIAFCEKERNAAYAVNVRGTLEVIRQLGRTTLQVIFFSSDYVFEGDTGHYDDHSETRPTTEYGRQKVLVEKEIPSLSDNYLILRLSKIYGTQKGDKTILDDMASFIASGREVRAAKDQVFCPTFVCDLVQAIAAIQVLGVRGTMNVCSPESWSRYGIALGVAEAMHIDPACVHAIGLHDVPGMAGRPLNTSLACSRLAAVAGISFTPLRDSLFQVASNWRQGVFDRRCGTVEQECS